VGWGAFEDRGCIEPGCDQMKKIGNYCKTHSHKYYQKTSDGVRGKRGTKKLTEEQCAEIKRFYKNFNTKHATAKKFGIGKDLLNQVLDGTYNPNE
jgi:DNA invertase Pin-like site-specific DNA recombinase